MSGLFVDGKQGRWKGRVCESPDGDAAEVRWFSPEELPDLKLAPDTADVIRKGYESDRARRA